jgi:hypothetical protein
MAQCNISTVTLSLFCLSVKNLNLGRKAYPARMMADTGTKLSDWTPISDEEQRHIGSQTSVNSHTKFGYGTLYRYASTVEIAGLVLCALCAMGAGVVTPLMTVGYTAFFTA